MSRRQRAAINSPATSWVSSTSKAPRWKRPLPKRWNTSPMLPNRAAHRPSTSWASCIFWDRMWSRTMPQQSTGSPRPQARGMSTHNSSSTTWSRSMIRLPCSALSICSVQWPRLSGRLRRQRRLGYTLTTLTANGFARFRRRRSLWATSRMITRSRAGVV